MFAIMLPNCVRTQGVWHNLSSNQGIKSNLVYIVQGRHSRFLVGKDTIVVATSPVRRHCRFLFLKIQPRTKPWLPCLPWQPCSIFTLDRSEALVNYNFQHTLHKCVHTNTGALVSTLHYRCNIIHQLHIRIRSMRS